MQNRSNRLNLNFSLPTNQERTQFLKNYLSLPNFKNKPLSNEELETCANYLLWGKDPDGKNIVQKKQIQLQGKNSPWTIKHEESLDALLETPTFNENLIYKPSSARPKIVKETFDREKELGRAPEDVKKLLTELFDEIDRIDLIINFYDLAHNKRKKPPRSELIAKFNENDLSELRQTASKLGQYAYLKLRHRLVELRRSQFSLRDMYSPVIQVEPAPLPPEDNAQIDADIPVFPLGLWGESNLAQKIFAPPRNLGPEFWSAGEVERVIKDFWHKNNQLKTLGKSQFFFDFENPEHIYGLLTMADDLSQDIDPKFQHIDSNLPALLKTLGYYVDFCELPPVQKRILELKMRHFKNVDVARIVNEEFGKTYTTNYISTIFKQKIVKKIAEGVTLHRDIILTLPDDDGFKVCTRCRRVLIKDQRNFVRKTSAKDGFTSRCKRCDKEIRDLGKKSTKIDQEAK